MWFSWIPWKCTLLQEFHYFENDVNLQKKWILWIWILVWILGLLWMFWIFSIRLFYSILWLWLKLSFFFFFKKKVFSRIWWLLWIFSIVFLLFISWFCEFCKKNVNFIKLMICVNFGTLMNVVNFFNWNFFFKFVTLIKIVIFVKKNMNFTNLMILVNFFNRIFFYFVLWLILRIL